MRREGGGRKSVENVLGESLDEAFLSVVADHVAGDPMNEKIKWLKLTQSEIRDSLKKHSIQVGRNVVRKLLKKHGFSKRKMQKKRSTGEFKDRDKQFNQIQELKEKFMDSEWGYAVCLGEETWDLNEEILASTGQFSSRDQFYSDSDSDEDKVKIIVDENGEGKIKDD